MKTIRNKITRYPENFLITANIVGCKPEDYVQYIINNYGFYICFYLQGDGKKIESSLLFMNALIKYIEDQGMVFNDQMRNSIIFYLTGFSFTDQMEKFSQDTKDGINKVITMQWEKEEAAKYGFPQTLNLPNGYTAKLTFDFNLCCISQGKTPKQMIMWILEQYSIADVKAQTQFDDEGLVDWSSPYLEIPQQYLNGEEKNKQHYPNKEINDLFEARYTELRTRLNSVTSYSERFRIYQKFYKDWDEELRTPTT